MKVDFDWIMWLLAAICFLLGALSVGVSFGSPDKNRSINWMLLGFTFIAVAQLN
jgi:putative Mn2+ efflux pump MntP